MTRLILFLAVVAFAAGCNGDKKSKEYLPKATGKPGDIIIIMDSAQWKDTLGREVRRVFESTVPGLPQDEPMFKVLWIQPSKGLRMLTQIRNLVYVFTLDQDTRGSKILKQDFSPETLNKIQQDTSFYLYSKKDEYAKGQQVMYLFGDTQDNLIAHLRKQKQNIIDYFNKLERERLMADLLTTRTTSGVTDFLKKEQECEIRVPIGYRLADKQEDFVWLRWMNAMIDKDIFISWKPYTSEYQMLPDSLIAWRNEICKKYIFEDPENLSSYLITEQTDAKVTARQVTVNDHFAMELRGLWLSNTRTMGGPFLSYAIIDEPRSRIYYVEGFVYAPGGDKREFVRELEAILNTFKTSTAIADKK